jgi:RHS repeat-associated protein
VRENDFVAIVDEYGDLVAEYTYDAWGCVLYTNEYTHNNIGYVNPIRYRSYYYDTETGFYYLESRYYDPAIRRFINADGYINANGDILGFNMYAYCGNNPVMGYDPTGEWDWGTFFDVTINIGSSILAVGVGTLVRVASNPVLGLIAGVNTFGIINNAVNEIYYENFSDGESNINNSSYQNGYIDRFDRLDYAKQRTKEEDYNLNSWRYYSEYNLHMYGWLATGWSDDKDIFLVSWVAERCSTYDENIGEWDKRTIVNIGTVILGLLGL